MGPLAVAVALAAGIAVAPGLDLPAGGCGLAAMVLAAIALRLARGRAARLFACAAIACVGAARGARPPVEVPRGASADDRSLDRIAGTIAGPTVVAQRGVGALLSPDDGDAIWVWSEAPLRSGERVAVTGRLRTPRGVLGPGAPDRVAAVLGRGARLELVAIEVERIADEPGPVARAWRWAAATQAAWGHRIDDAGGDRAARAALRGIVVGDRADIPEALDARWRAVGVFHVLSVSGLHLAVIAGLAFALLRRGLAALPFGGRIRPARWAAPPALALAIAYTMITGAQLATVRALLVIALVLAAAMLDRPVRLVDAIGTAAIVVLAWRPADLFDPSFQLSFTAALVLALAPKITTRRGIRGWIVRGLATSAWVTIATAPITAYHFQQVTPGGVVGNLVLTPLLELAALPCALIGVVLHWGAPIRLATWLVSVVDGTAGVMAIGAPVGRIALVGGGTLAALVALSLWLAARARRTRADALAWLCLCVGWACGRAPAAIGELRVTFLDVGQGDAAIVELPDGAVWLVDAGGIANARDAAAAAAPGRTIARTLAVYGRHRIDLAILSHPHPDHYLGFAALDLPIDELWSAAELEPAADGAFDQIARALAARGTRLVHPTLGLAHARAGVELIVWAPRYDAAPGVAAADPVRTINDNSLVVELRYRGRAILFAGDLEDEGETAVVAAGLAPVDVVKVAHHGSPTSSTPAFVAATHPTLAVISCARANQFGFPSAAVVERWGAGGAEVLRTDRDGAVTVHVDAAGGLAVERFVGAAR